MSKHTSLAEYHAASANPLVKPGLIKAPLALTARDGHKLVDLREFGLFPGMLGADNNLGGYQTAADVVTETADGVDLNQMWAEFQAVLDVYNQARSHLVSILTYTVTDLIESVPVVGTSVFQQATEFGVPTSVRPGLAYKQLAYDFNDYDIAIRYTWKFLRDADARQLAATHDQVLGADNQLVFRKVMEALFDNTDRNTKIRNTVYNVYPLYNADGDVPPAYKGVTFDGTHNHYMVSGSTVIDSGDFEAAYDNLAEHGYGLDNSTVIVAMMPKALINEVRKWRVGEANGADPEDPGAPVANYDFIPAANQPTLIVPNAEGLLGTQPPSSWNGLPVIGSYAGVLIVEEAYIPSGYFLMLATGGAGQLQNPVGIREHANAAYRGLRLLPGNQQRYPLVDSFYARGFGTGIRQRGGAVIMQIKASGSYVVPTQYANNGDLSAA